MNPLSILLSIFGLGLSVFGYWGMFTKAGNRAYDEMNGMYPFFAFVAGILFLLIALIVFLVNIIKKKRTKKK